jgi:hypothetical protein
MPTCRFDYLYLCFLVYRIRQFHFNFCYDPIHPGCDNKSCVIIKKLHPQEYPLRSFLHMLYIWYFLRSNTCCHYSSTIEGIKWETYPISEFRSHFCIIKYDTGNAVTFARKTHLIMSFSNNIVNPETDSPNTFLIPISFVRLAIVSEASATRPNNAIKMEIIVAKKIMLFIFESDLYCVLKWSSTHS